MEREPMNVLIAGGGVAALEAALALHALADDQVRVELLAPEPHFWYRPLAVAEPFGLGDVARFDLAELAASAGATFTLGALAAVDAGRHIAYTSNRAPIPYDTLLVACGAVPRPAVRGALTFRGPADTELIRGLLDEIDRGEVRCVAFVVPSGAAWTLPAYELALLTAAHAASRRLDVELSLLTPEDEPLGLFGRAASDAVSELLGAGGIAVRTGVHAIDFRDGELGLVRDDAVRADRVVALPRLEGPQIDGIAQTAHGFVPVDAFGRVHGVEDVFAAGDITSFPVKQGGLAAQQADAAAEAIAAAAGVDLDPRPFRPVLRGILLSGDGNRYLKRELVGGETATASRESLWWPPAKIVGRHLAPFLAGRGGRAQLESDPAPPGAVPVEVDLSARDLHALAPGLTAFARERGVDQPGAAIVRDVMTADPIVVAPEDTLGEVAERMRERDDACALVSDFGRLIGILTSRDLLRAFAARAHPSEARVREWMTAEPLAVTAATTLDAAALLMTESRVHHLAVVEGSRPVGVVGMRDVVRPATAGGLRVSVGLGY